MKEILDQEQTVPVEILFLAIVWNFLDNDWIRIFSRDNAHVNGALPLVKHEVDVIE